MFRKLCWKNLAWVAFGVVIVSPVFGDAGSDEEHIIEILKKSRHLTFGGHSMALKLDYVYPDSLFEMARNLSENDIPVLLKILEKDNDFQDKFSAENRDSVAENFKLAQGASYGLASLCVKSIEPIVAEVKAQRLDPDLQVKNAPLHWIGALSGIPGGCPPEDAERAKAAQQEIGQLNKVRQAQSRFEYGQRQADAYRLNQNALKMQSPESAKTLTLEERKEVFQNSVKAMRLDKSPLTPDQKVLWQKMYDTMVLQKGGPSSNSP